MSKGSERRHPSNWAAESSKGKKVPQPWELVGRSLVELVENPPAYPVKVNEDAETVNQTSSQVVIKMPREGRRVIVFS